MSGLGRGRGWLNLKAGNPGAMTTSPVLQGSQSPTNSSVSPQNSPNAQFTDSYNDYLGLVNKIKHLDIADDGIKFNQKIRYIVENWNEECTNSQQVAESFDIIHEACLTDSDLATKVVLLIASRTFLNQTIHDNNIRLMFLRKLQDSFENCVEVQKQNPNNFRNCVQMMGEFYNKARMANGMQFVFMATALCSYLEMLLETAQPADLILFATQLYLNGSSLRNESPEQFTELLNKTRLLLCSDRNITKECKLWLLLALEVASNRFALLPADIQTFYYEHLGESNMASFQGTPAVLSVQTHQGSKKMDSYQSNVNVLQVSDNSNPSDPNVSSPSNTATGTDISLSVNNYNSSGFQSDSSDNSHINNIVKDLRSKLNNGDKQAQSNNSQSYSKTSSQPAGRPILGVGARLQRNRLTTDDSASANDSAMSSSFENSWRDSKDRVSRDRHQENNRDCKENKHRKDSTDHPGSRDKRDSRDHGENRDRKDIVDHQVDQDQRDRREYRENRGPRENKDTRDQRENREQRENRDHKDGNWRNHGNQNQGRKSGGDRIQRKSGGADWDNKKKNFSPPKQSNKNWQEHDDRFETDYS